MNWNETFRAEFPSLTSKVYVDIAFNNPTPPVVVKAMADFWNRIGEGQADKQPWLVVADAVRGQLARLVNGRAGGIAFTKNTVEGVNIVAQGLTWKPGDNVVVFDQDHHSTIMPWLNLSGHGVTTRVISSPDYRLPPEAIFAAMDARTRVVALSSVQNGTGFRADLAAIGARCRETGTWLVVDGIQSVGLMEMDAAAWGIDAVACGGHKGLFGPHGVGFLYGSDRLLEALRPVYAGPSPAVKVNKANGWEMEPVDLLDARRLELSNFNYPAIHGLHEGLRLIERAGLKTIEAHILRLAAALHSGLIGQGYRVISPDGPGERSGLVSVAGEDVERFSSFLKASGIVSSKLDAGFIRFSFGPFNDDSDVAAVLAATGTYAPATQGRRR